MHENKIKLEDITITKEYLQEKLENNLNIGNNLLNSLNPGSISLDVDRVDLREDLKDIASYDNPNPNPVKNVVNPYQALNKKFQLSSKTYEIKKPDLINIFRAVFLACLIGFSVLLNNYFLEKIDPHLYDYLKLFSLKGANLASGLNAYIVNQKYKPFVVTIGNYKSADLAKEMAVQLLPKFKYIEIKKLGNSSFTLVIDRHSSKNKAYMLAKKISRENFEAVHVRYLLD